MKWAKTPLANKTDIENESKEHNGKVNYTFLLSSDRHTCKPRLSGSYHEPSEKCTLGGKAHHQQPTPHPFPHREKKNHPFTQYSSPPTASPPPHSPTTPPSPPQTAPPWASASPHAAPNHQSSRSDRNSARGSRCCACTSASRRSCRRSWSWCCRCRWSRRWSRRLGCRGRGCGLGRGF